MAAWIQLRGVENHTRGFRIVDGGQSYEEWLFLRWLEAQGKEDIAAAAQFAKMCGGC